MRSTAHFRSHPIHPALIPFPFAFLVGSVLFDLAGWLANESTFWHTAGHLALAGIATAVLAAIPGVVDYIYAVPPKSSAKRRATRHAVANLAAIGLFGAAWAIRGLQEPPTAVTFGMTLLGAGLLAYGSWLGGTLVTRNLIGVDHRYANKGRWSEVSLPDTGWQVAAGPGDLQDGQMRLIRAGGRRLVLARTEEGYVAFQDRCTHRGGSLAGGVLIGGTVQCLWHGAQFDCGTGRVVCGPAGRALRTYEVRESPRGVEVLV